MRPTWTVLADALSAAHHRLEATFPGHVPGARPVAIGWATVETERAEAELVHALGARIGSFTDAPGDRLLGARCRTATGGPASSLAILEPSTEGRLAGSLARLGEGPVAVWFMVPAGPIDGTSEPADGPFGPERLVLHGPRDGRHVFLLDGRPGTIGT